MPHFSASMTATGQDKHCAGAQGASQLPATWHPSPADELPSSQQHANMSVKLHAGFHHIAVSLLTQENYQPSPAIQLTSC